MAKIKKNGGLMTLPVSFARNNSIPIDPTTVWYSYDEMAAYAACYYGLTNADIDAYGKEYEVHLEAAHYSRCGFPQGGFEQVGPMAVV